MPDALNLPDPKGRVLMVNYYFPPLGGMGSRRASRFAAALPAVGWGTDVLTVEDGHYHRTEGGWAPPAGTTVVRTPSFELGRLSRRVATGALGGEVPAHGEGVLAPVALGGTGSRIRAAIRAGLYIPDAHVGWLPWAVAAGRMILEVTAGDGLPRVIYSSSVPYTGHLVAARLRREFNLPWVAEFRDLWIGGQTRDGVPAWREALDARIEASIVREADVVVFTTENSRQRTLEKFPELDPDRVRVVTNAWEAGAHPPHSPPGAAEPFVLIHAGTLDPAGVQDPGPVLEAAAELRAEGEGALVLRLFGPEGPWMARCRELGLPENLLDIRGTVPAATIPEELARGSATLMLLPGERFRPVLLGKTFEWLGSGLPAVVIADTKGDTARMVREAGGAILVERNERRAIKAALRALIVAQREGRLDEFAPSPQVARRYEVEQVTERLVNAFRQAIERRTG